MTIQEQKLSAEQKELVAVGASVGAGCHPCVSHHLKAAVDAGLEGEQLLAAVASAERVSAEAAVAMGDHARAKLGASVTSPALLSRFEEALASLGAALGANDAANIDRQLRAAADLGASRSQLQQAIDTAHDVQENAVRIHLRKAERLLDALRPATATLQTDADSDGGCGRGVGDEIDDAPGAADEPEAAATSRGDESGEGCACGPYAEAGEAPVADKEPVAATSRHASRCSPTATQSAESDPSAMARCREMVERFMPAVPAAEPDKAAAAAAASNEGV